MRPAANTVGLAVSSALVIAALNVVPGMHVGILMQSVAILACWIANLVTWKNTEFPPIPPLTVFNYFGLGLLAVAAISVFDTLLGFALGQRTVWQAFLHSGAFGGIADIFLFVCVVFVGGPTLVRAAYLHDLK